MTFLVKNTVELKNLQENTVGEVMVPCKLWVFAVEMCSLCVSILFSLCEFVMSL